MKTDTRCVHNGTYFDKRTGGINTPIFTSSAYDYLDRAQMTGFGAMLSFELDSRQARADRSLRHLELIRPAVSLGGVETTICAPVVTSHAKMTAEERERIVITDDLLRLSVGIEDPDDLNGRKGTDGR